MSQTTRPNTPSVRTKASARIPAIHKSSLASPPINRDMKLKVNVSQRLLRLAPVPLLAMIRFQGAKRYFRRCRNAK